jgi:hypothetical protein
MNLPVFFIPSHNVFNHLLERVLSGNAEIARKGKTCKRVNETEKIREMKLTLEGLDSLFSLG